MYKNQGVLSAELDNYEAVFKYGSWEEYQHLRWFWMKNFGGEEPVLRMFLEDLAPNDTIIDVGANIGIYSCFSQQAMTTGKIIAFEPHPGNFNRLNDNLRMNDNNDNGSGVSTEIHQMALSNRAENIEIGAYEDDVIGKGTFSSVIETNQTLEVKARRLDDLINTGEVPQPDIIKIDVEGAELDVLKGAKNTLTKTREVFVEVHPEMGIDPQSVKHILKNSGMEVNTVGERGKQHFLIGRKQ